MKKLVVALLVSLLAVLPVSATASWYNETNQDLVRWAGCTATVIEWPQFGPEGSYYLVGSHTIVFGTKPTMSKDAALMILFHETGHCLQFQNRDRQEVAELFDYSQVNLELDADRWAAQLACARHLDGRTLLHDVFVEAYEKFDYEGDSNHGTLAQRISQGNRAEACRAPVYGDQ